MGRASKRKLDAGRREQVLARHAEVDQGMHPFSGVLFSCTRNGWSPDWERRVGWTLLVMGLLGVLLALINDQLNPYHWKAHLTSMPLLVLTGPAMLEGWFSWKRWGQVERSK